MSACGPPQLSVSLLTATERRAPFPRGNTSCALAYRPDADIVARCSEVGSRFSTCDDGPCRWQATRDASSSILERSERSIWVHTVTAVRPEHFRPGAPSFPQMACVSNSPFRRMRKSCPALARNKCFHQSAARIPRARAQPWPTKFSATGSCDGVCLGPKADISRGDRYVSV